MLNSVMKEKLLFSFSLFFGSVIIFFLDFLGYILNSSIYSNMDILSWIYYMFASFTQASVFSLILFLCFHLLFIVFNKKSIAVSIYMVLAICLQFVIVLDIFIFSIYRFHINGFILELVFGGAGDQIFVFDQSLYLKVGGMALAFCLLPFSLNVYIVSKVSKKIHFRHFRNYSIIFVASLLISNFVYMWAYATNYMSIQKATTALPYFYPLRANKLLTKIGLMSADDFDSLQYNENTTDLKYGETNILVSDSIPKYNIIYILIDSWNPRTFDPEITPNICSFSHKGQIFANHLSSSNGTQGSLFGLFFGLPYTYGNDFIMSKMSPIFIDRLIACDYDINVHASASFNSPPFNKIIFRRVPDIKTETEGKTPFERDNKITKDFLDFLDKKREKPFFSFLFYDLPHAISIPEEYQKQFQPSWKAPDYTSLNNEMDPTPYFNLYKNCVFYTDKLIGEILSKIEKQGLLDNTIILISGDHGQEFNENKKNYWGHSSNYSKWQIQVPFLIYYPDIEAGKTYDHVTTHYDLAPTVSRRFLGVQSEPDEFSMGYDLWDSGNSRFPHIVGEYINYSFIMDNKILNLMGHTGELHVTDLDLNNLPRSVINKEHLQEALKRKNKFYK